MRVFQRFFIKAFKNVKMDIYKCPKLKKILKFIFAKLCIYTISWYLFFIYNIYLKIYVLIGGNIFIVCPSPPKIQGKCENAKIIEIIETIKTIK